MVKPTQAEINNAVWRACDTFRGSVDPADYKNYVLVFFFFKYLSDVHKKHLEELRDQYPGDDELVRRKLARDRFVIPEGATFDDVLAAARRDETDLGDRINKALTAIEDANRRKLSGVFRDIDFNSESNLGKPKERNRRLKNLINDFADPRLDFRPFVDASPTGKDDVIGNAYQFLIERFASDAGKKGGEFFTPPSVSHLIARLLKPRAGERIYDPTIGSGSLAITLAEAVRDENGDPSRDFALYGQESNGATWALAKMNAVLHGIDAAHIEWGNTLLDPKHTEGEEVMRFEVVGANPPFSLKKWGAAEVARDRYGRFDLGVPPDSKADFAFVLHMAASLTTDTGRAGIVVPHGVLFRGSREGKIRQALVEANLLDAVVGLPSGLFFGTPIPAAVLVLRKHRETTDVLFVDASRDFDGAQKQNRLREEHLDRIEAAYEAYDFEDKYAYRATREEIAGNGFNLNIPRYVDTFEPEAPVDLEAVQTEIDALEAELAETRDKLRDKLERLGLPA